MLGLLVIIIVSWLLLHFIEKKNIEVLGIIPTGKRIAQFFIGMIFIMLINTINIYIESIVNEAQETGPIPGWSSSESSGSNSEDSDELYDEAVNFVIESRRASISAVQRKLRIGYNRAARLIETMEEAGLVTEMSSNGSREVLVPKRQ